MHGLQDGAGTPGVSNEQIEEIVGEGARDRGGKGNANVGDGGVAFVLSSSGPSAGGSETVSHAPATLMACTPSTCQHTCFMVCSGLFPPARGPYGKLPVTWMQTGHQTGLFIRMVQPFMQGKTRLAVI